ncbi:MAG: Crp/Fnr family transcriptional regulator [Magnetospirillum sp.]|nr:Crp/Fnr family transcriptional regulator [Roseomonas sp.]MBX9633371.1 Crp/Fnr family transcriptional regulator [Magnetospirillum sp.]
MSHAAKTLVPRPSLHLCEETGQSTAGVNLLAGLDDAEVDMLMAVASPLSFGAGDMVFRQGDHHDGIFIIVSGQVRIFYTGPSGREITLAYWSPGNFCGGPEIFGGSPHMWSGQAVRPAQVLHVPGPDLRRLVGRLPRLAISLLDAMVHKGKCFSSLIQMLGTRSAAERLAQLLVLMADLDGHRKAEGIVISRTLTQEDLAKMVGSTRQWVSSMLDRLRESGVVEVTPQRILLRDEMRLRALASQ